MLQVGDRVEVTNPNLAYAHYQSWIEKNAPEFLLYWKKNTFLLNLCINTDLNNFLIVAKAPESESPFSKTELCLIQGCNGDAFLMSSDALQQIQVMFSVGNVVRLYDNRLVYTEYETWFDKNAPELKSQYKKDEYPVVGEKYEIVKQASKGDFLPFSCQILCAIRNFEKENPSVFLVDKNALFIEC